MPAAGENLAHRADVAAPIPKLAEVERLVGA
jgi:hypothetical protein